MTKEVCRIDERNLIDGVVGEKRLSFFDETCRQDGGYIWYMNINEFGENDQCEVWQYHFESLSPFERDQINKKIYFDDRKRSMISLLIQKALIREYLRCGDSEFTIERTRENKPYVRAHNKDTGFWNYNVSHHGSYVAIASHEKFLMGADIVDLQTKLTAGSNVNALLKIFSKHFHSDEIAFIQSQRGTTAQLNAFYIHWSLKEAFVKAIGLGLGFDLGSICLEISFWDKAVFLNGPIEGHATVKINGVHRNDWGFHFLSLDERHVLSIARGPLKDSTESYVASAWKKCDLNLLETIYADMKIDPELSQKLGWNTSSIKMDLQPDLHPNPYTLDSMDVDSEEVDDYDADASEFHILPELFLEDSPKMIESDAKIFNERNSIPEYGHNNIMLEWPHPPLERKTPINLDSPEDRLLRLTRSAPCDDHHQKCQIY